MATFDLILLGTLQLHYVEHSGLVHLGPSRQIWKYNYVFYTKVHLWLEARLVLLLYRPSFLMDDYSVGVAQHFSCIVDINNHHHPYIDSIAMMSDVEVIY